MYSSRPPKVPNLKERRMRAYGNKLVLAMIAALATGTALGEEPGSESPLLKGMQPCMICCTKRDLPSPQEWLALTHDTQRSALLGGVADFKSRTIAFNNSRYYTFNATEGTLASYGKMGSDKRYDRYAQIEGVEFAVDQNSW